MLGVVKEKVYGIGEYSNPVDSMTKMIVLWCDTLFVIWFCMSQAQMLACKTYATPGCVSSAHAANASIKGPEHHDS